MQRVAANSTASLQILHLTDPHLFADESNELRGVNTHSSLQRVLDRYRGDGWQADLAIVSGDLIQDDSAEAYAHFRRLLESLGLPVYCVPGNHDTRRLMQAALASEPFHYCAASHHGNWMLLGVDSCQTGTASGALSETELARIRDAVAASSAEHIVLYLHHPPVTLHSKWLDSVGLVNADALLDCVAKSPRVRALLFGHAHQAFDSIIGGTRILGTPSTCRQFKPQSDDYAVDDLPPAYRRLTLHRDGTVDTKLVWLNDA